MQMKTFKEEGIINRSKVFTHSDSNAVLALE